LRLGPDLGGGTQPVSPLGFDLVSQRIYTPVVFDVRQEASLDGVAQRWIVPSGSNRFHASAYGFYGNAAAGGLTVASPLGSEDYQFFAGLEYDGRYGFSGAGRFDGLINADNRMEVTAGRLAAPTGAEMWASAGFTSHLGERSSNRAQAGWYGTAGGRQMLVSDDFSFAAGRQRLLAGVQFSHENFLPADSAATRFDFYVQDAVRLGRRLTLTGGIRFCFPFAFSPRVSFNYDVTGTGAVVLRAGTAVYGRSGEGSVWKNLAAVDTRLPLDFLLTLEAVYGQSWRRLFYISSRNVLDSHYALTARLERPFADRAWALASYTHTDGLISDRLLAGFSYKAEYLSRLATTVSVLYTGHRVSNVLYSSTYGGSESFSWENVLQARVSQDVVFPAGGRDHCLQLTAYLHRNLAHSGGTFFLIGLRYLL